MGRFEEFFHKINPKAEVPTLVLPDDSIMTESAAMMIYIWPISFRRPDWRRPSPRRSARATCAGWLFLATALYMSDLRLFYPQRYTTVAAEDARASRRARKRP